MRKLAFMSVFHNRQFLSLWTAGTLTFAASTLTTVLLPVLAIDHWSDASFGPALVSFGMGIPWLILGLQFGVLADLVSTRAALVASAAVRSLALGAAALGIMYTGVPSGVILIAVSFVVGSATVLRSIATQAALPKIVPKEERTLANSWQFRSSSALELASLILGGALTALSAPVGLLVAAGLSLLSIPPSLIVDAPASEAREKTSLLAGFKFLFANAMVRQSTIVTTAWRLSAGVGSALAIPYLVQGLNVRGATLGLAMGAIGVGVFAGSVALPYLDRKFTGSANLWRALLALGAVGGVVRALPLSNLSVYAFIFGGACIGFAITTTSILVTTQRMNLTPRENLSQVAGAYSMIVWGAMPIGAAIGTSLLAVFDEGTAFLIGSLLLLICPVIAWFPPLGRQKSMDASNNQTESD